MVIVGRGEAEEGMGENGNGKKYNTGEKRALVQELPCVSVKYIVYLQVQKEKAFHTISQPSLDAALKL